MVLLGCNAPENKKDHDFVEVTNEAQTTSKIEEKCFKCLAGQSIYDSLDQKIGNEMLKNQFFEIFKDKINFQTLDATTQVSICFQIIPRLHKEDSMHILGASLLSPKQVKMAFWFEHAKAYFDEKGQSLQGMFLAMPLPFGLVTSHYSQARFHPIEKIVKPHLGIDFAAPIGTPVLASAEGILIEKNFQAANGLYLKIKHHGAFATQYLHLSRFAAIKVGQHVQKGEIIGYVGQSGLATGPHLCYRLWEHGRQINPALATNTRSFKLNNDNFVAFLQANQKMREILF
jgi:murein DD-endopeptidase MepM/ murein hydrolase activator NlpD